MNSYGLDQFVCDASLTSDLNRLLDLWSRFVDQFGVNGYRVVPVSPFVQSCEDELCDIAHNTPVGWLDRYKEQGYHRFDPVLAREIADPGPFSWNEVHYGSVDKRGLQIKEESRELGIINGISLSCWFSPGLLYAIGLYIPESRIELNEVLKRTIQAASFIFCTRYRDISRDHIPETPDIRLSARESDVLRWIALGKSKNDIAALLHISLSTVKRHCESLYIKLGVNNMPGAVARAMSLGFVKL